MRKLGLLIIILVLLGGGAIAGAAFLIPSAFYQQKIEDRASLILGREVRIEGPVNLRFWPSLQVKAEAVSIANPPGFGPDGSESQKFASMKAMRTSVALLPLFSRKVEIKEFILVEPKIMLERRRDGAVNWAIGANAQAKTRAQANSGFERRPGALPLSASFGDVRLIDGDIKINDRSNGKSHHLANVNLTLKMPTLSAKMTAKGSMAFNGKDYAVDATLGGLKPFLEGEHTPLQLSLENALFNARFDGAFAKSKDMVANGTLSVKVPSVRALAQETGAALPPSADTFGAFSIDGMAKATTKSFSFQDAKLRFDALVGEGSFGVVFAGARPKLTGNLTMDRLDITPYLPPQTAARAGVPPWSTATFNLGMLKAADARFKFTLNSLKMREISIGNSVLETALVNGRLQADLVKMELYEGQGTGTIVVNARGRTPSFSLTSDITDVAFQPLLTDSVKFRRLAGTGNASLSLLSSGSSQAEVMNTISGTGKFHVKDGKIIGVNLASVLRTAKTLLLGNDGSSNAKEEQVTDFSDLSASFKTNNGVARTEDFLLSAPVIRVPGKGLLDIGGQTVDFRLTPRAVASLEGQGGKTDLGGIEAPFRIHGPWNSIKAGLDKSAIKNVAKKKIGKFLSRQLGGGDGDSAGEGSQLDDNGQAREKSSEEKAIDAIGSLFKKKKKKKKD